MMKKTLLGMVVVSVMGLLVSASLIAQPTNVYMMKVLSGSRIWVEGDSTLHRYKSVTSVIGLENQIAFRTTPTLADGPVQTLVTNKAFAPTLKRLVLNLAVKNFHSKIMGFDSQFHKTLKSAEHPNISFTISNYTVAADNNASDRFIIRTNGTVRIAGKDKEITVTSIAKLGEQSATVSGQTDLLMTDFMIEPPRLMFVTTDNKVTIKWNLIMTLEPREPALLSEK